MNEQDIATRLEQLEEQVSALSAQVHALNKENHALKKAIEPLEPDFLTYVCNMLSKPHDDDC